MKNRFLQSLYYTWWVYLLIFALSFLTWKFIYAKALEPKLNEKLEITFFNEYDFDELSFNNYYKDNLSKIKNNIFKRQDIKRIYLETIFANQPDIYTIARTRNSVADIMIIEEPYILLGDKNDSIEQISPKNFCGFKLEDFSKICLERGFDINMVEFLTVDDMCYGICLTNDLITNNFEHYYDKDTKAYAFFTMSSHNICSLNEKGKTTDGAAIDLIFYLLEQYNE